MSVCCECCVLLGRGLCDGLITRPEESYRLWCVVVCDLETSRMRRPCSLRAGATKTNKQETHSSLACRRVKHSVTYIPFVREYAVHFNTENFPLELVSHESVIRY
jgi:hypothetical protein